MHDMLYTPKKGSFDYIIHRVECAVRGVEKVYYYQESSRNAYSQGEEHLDGYR